jgi:hypothetical protein
MTRREVITKAIDRRTAQLGGGGGYYRHDNAADAADSARDPASWSVGSNGPARRTTTAQAGHGANAYGDLPTQARNVRGLFDAAFL